MKGLTLFVLFTAFLLGIVITWASYLNRQPVVSEACQQNVKKLAYPMLKYITIAWDYRLTTDGRVLAWPRTIFNLPAAYVSFSDSYDCEVGENGSIKYPFIK